jgi:hypothetical protein
LSPTCAFSPARLLGMYLATLYKARDVPTKQPVCAICVDRTRGKTQRMRLGYGVEVWLCGGHADEGFMTKRGGRDFVTTMLGVWRACGSMTSAKGKALDAHLARLKGRPPRQRPGSYAWPAVRAAVERAFAGGASLEAVLGRVRATEYGRARAPSRRTVQRWQTERRWLHGLSPPGAALSQNRR